jgi:signal transduction histidine kinase
VVIFVTLGYVAAVVLLGALVGGHVSEEYWASVVATALVALAFQPLRRGVQRLGDRAVYGRRAAPYQALADLCRRLARAVSLEQVLPGIAEVSGRSIGAAHASVRLAVPGADDVVAHWPIPSAPGNMSSTEHSEPVWQGTERLGEITVSMPAGREVSRTDRTLLADIATQAGLGMRNAQLAAQLRVQVHQAGAQTEELEASRLRLLAAQESQRQRLTRAVRAEVLPHLAQLRIWLAQAAAATDPTAASRCLDAAMETTNRGLEALRDIARGVFPPLLARKGLAAALRVYAARARGRVALTVAPAVRTARFPSHLEAVTYFCAVETVRELGGSALVDLDLDDSDLTLTVTAADLNGRLAEGGQGVVDRVLAWDGTVTIDGQGAPARLRISLPQRPVTAQTAVNVSGPNADLAR